MTIKNMLEPLLEPIFDKDSYGYRPRKSAHEAVGITRERCWKYAWVLECDIKGLFDNIPHDLLMKALKHHTKEKWILLYVERWLKAPMSKDGVLIERTKGTPQGGVISPLLANLFLHYCFDLWVRRNHPEVEFCRYADDGVLHFRNRNEAEFLKKQLQSRFNECGLEMHPEKTKIVYCKSGQKRENFKNISFDFLGFSFRPRMAKNKNGSKFLSFLPGVSRNALKAMRQEVRHWKLHLKTAVDLQSLSKFYNPKIRGWFNYYSKYYRTALYPLWDHINGYLVR
jgi:RNA-directed DNA polymerase